MNSSSEKDERALHIRTTYYRIRDIMKERQTNIIDWSVIMQLITVDFIDALGQMDNVEQFMEDYKILIMKAVRSKRGYS